MKTFFILFTFASFANTSLNAQKQGDFVMAIFDASPTVYYARVISVENDIVTANFVHSNSVYKFTKGEKFTRPNVESDLANDYKGEVISNIGGKFGKGSAIYYSIASPTKEITTSTPCENELAILEFEDGKTFLAYSNILNESIYKLIILHSDKTYQVDINSKKILSSDGTYKAGRYVKNIYCTNYRANQRTENSPK